MGTKTQKLSNVVDSIVEWQSVVVADGSTNTTGVSGRGYFINTSSGAHTINLPASPKIGDVIKVSLITAGNQLTIGRNGNNINGSAADITTSTDGDVFELVYVNTSEGWKTVGQIAAPTFTSATGGTVTTSGNYKIHTFTGDGCFVVSTVGNNSINSAGGPNSVDYLVIAGGGSGGKGRGGGGGAGGYRESSGAASGCYTRSPLGACVSALPVSATTYPVTVGAGGTAQPGSDQDGNPGSNSIFSTITSAGGGKGGGVNPSCSVKQGGPGGSGGGAGGTFCSSSAQPGGSGNTPPVSPPQGNNGGNGNGNGPPNVPATSSHGAAGGGAGGVGSNATGTPAPGGGGPGLASSITGSPVTRGGGGGGASDTGSTGGGPGCGGNGYASPGSTPAPTNGGANSGGGGGGVKFDTNSSGAGGKGIVILRYKYQ